MLKRLLDAGQLSRSDVTVVPMSESKHEWYYQQGKADAVVSLEHGAARSGEFIS